jgi:hypothetical protein
MYIYRRLEFVAKTGRLAEQMASVLSNLLPPKIGRTRNQ